MSAETATADAAFGRRELLWTALLALALAGGLYLAERRIDWNPADEGYLWYGVVATAHGAVPLRDFRSYDPARYLWCAAWARLLGDGILALRFSAALFGAAGLFCGLRAARRAVRGPLALAAAGIVLVLWMSPRHKLFESAIEMALVLAAVRLIEAPTPRRHLALGVTVGFAGFVGKNHGLYGVVASLALIAYLAWREREVGEPPETAARAPAAAADAAAARPRRRLPLGLGSWIAGLAVGASPFLAMCAIPGFFGGFVRSCRFYLASGRTNAPVPIVWPWGSYAGLTGWDLAQRTAIGACHLLWPLLCAGALALALATRRDRLAERRLAIGAGFVACCYLHHLFARADIFHLTQASHPMLLAAIGLPLAVAPARRRPAAAAIGTLLALLTVAVAVPQSELFDWLTSRDVPAERLVPYRLRGDDLRLHARAVRLYDGILRTVAERVPADEPLFVAPDWPGIYVLLGRPAPVWDILPTWPGVGGLDESLLAELRAHRVRWALLARYPLPPSEGEPFDEDFPSTSRYLAADFERVPTPELPRRVWLLRRRQPGVSFEAGTTPNDTSIERRPR